MLQLDHLSLRHGPRLLFEDASAQIHPGQRVGITGANGCGKSSLLALILGRLQADAGHLSLPAPWVIAHVAQEMPATEQPAIDYVLDGDAELRELEAHMDETEGERLAEVHARYDHIGGYQARSRAARLLFGLGFRDGAEERPVASFSGGWRMRLNLARALMCRSDLLLLDEPTNHLDLDAVIWLEGWLRGYRGTLLLISHDRDFLDGVCTHIAQIAQQRLELQAGDYSTFERRRAEQLANQQALYERQQRAIAHMEDFVRRFRAKATKARQAQSRLKALERLPEIAPAHVDSPFRFQLFPPPALPDPLLRLDDAATGYDGTALLSGVTLSIRPGDRIGLLGPNGAGKSTLIKLLAGQLPLLAGERQDAQALGIGYFAQHQLEQLDVAATPLLHLQRLDPKASEQALRDYLGRFGFIGDQALATVGPFSGGEKARLALALLIYRRPNLLLLDEPTNHLDIEMREALASALQDFEGAMLIISHDRHLLRVTIDQILLVDQGRLTEFDGDLDDYPAWLQRRNAASSGNGSGQRTEPSGAGQQAPDAAGNGGAGQPGRGSTPGDDSATSAASSADRKARKREEAEQRRRTQPLRNRIATLERELEQAQQRQQALHDTLADPALYQAERKAECDRLLAEQRALTARIETLEADWLEASEELEQIA